MIFYDFHIRLQACRFCKKLWYPVILFMDGRILRVFFPAHGGSDPGMTASDGTEEKEINLAISLKLREILEESGYQVVMTRDTDKGLYDNDAGNRKAQDLARRIELIEAAEPVLTVSIHQNSYVQDPSISGPQVFYYESSENGKKLAETIQKRLNTALDPERPREIKSNTTYYLLRKSSGTLVIVECGFLTNSREAALLKTSEYQKKTANAVAEGIQDFLRG